MDESRNERIRDWVARNLPRVSVSNPASNHLDEILGEAIAPSQILSVSLELFGSLVEQIRARGNPVQPILVIPLISEKQYLERAVPESQHALMEQWRSEEPPSLYLVDWAVWTYASTAEEYRCPLPFELVSPDVHGVTSYYREFREPDDRKSQAEFTRAVYVRYFPPDRWL